MFVAAGARPRAFGAGVLALQAWRYGCRRVALVLLPCLRAPGKVKFMHVMHEPPANQRVNRTCLRQAGYPQR
jgi:hypothetical protein